MYVYMYCICTIVCVLCIYCLCIVYIFSVYCLCIFFCLCVQCGAHVYFACALLAVYFLSIVDHWLCVTGCADNFSRVLLEQQPGVEGSDYINASYIDVSCLCDSLISSVLLLLPVATV